MSTVAQLKKRLLAVRGKAQEFAIQALNDNREIAADLNASQLAQGMMKDGKLSKFEYSPVTVAIKETKTGLSSVTDHLTNYDTGESYQKLYMRANENVVTFGTYTDKEESISKRMKNKAFGLTNDNKEEFIRLHAQQSFNKLMKENLKL